MKLAQLTAQLQRIAAGSADPRELERELAGMGISLENLYQELEMSSSYADSHQDISHTGRIVPPHSHSFYELIQVSTCQGVQYLLGTQRYQLQPGDVLFIPPGVSHGPLFPPKMQRPYERTVVWINADLLQEFWKKWPELSSRRPYLLRTAGTVWENPIAEAFLRGCEESRSREPGWEAALCANATLLITLMNRARLGREEPGSEGSELLDEMLRYVEANLSGPISVGSAARALLVSESTVAHLCRKRLGISFYRYVTRQRLTLARQLMERDLSLNRIAERAGFSDYSAFFRAFRQEYGISPQEYRKLRKGAPEYSQKDMPGKEG